MILKTELHTASIRVRHARVILRTESKRCSIRRMGVRLARWCERMQSSHDVLGTNSHRQSHGKAPEVHSTKLKSHGYNKRGPGGNPRVVLLPPVLSGSLAATTPSLESAKPPMMTRWAFERLLRETRRRMVESSLRWILAQDPEARASCQRDNKNAGREA